MSFDYMSGGDPVVFSERGRVLTPFEQRRKNIEEALRQQDYRTAIQLAKEGERSYFFFLVAEDLAREAIADEGRQCDACDANQGCIPYVFHQAFGIETHFPLLKGEDQQFESPIEDLLEALVQFIFPDQQARDEWKAVLARYRQDRHPEAVLESPTVQSAEDLLPAWDKLRFLWKTDQENGFPVSPNLEILFHALEEIYRIIGLVRRAESIPGDPFGPLTSRFRCMIQGLVSF